jgi:hypothetical protein
MTTIIDGSLGVTFPNGTNAQAAPSKVLQVVNATYNTQATTASLSPVTTGFSASITPLFSTSKILVLSTSSVAAITGSAGVALQLWRGGSSIFNLSPVTSYIVVGSSLSQLNTATSALYLDSPATTSSVTYTIYFSAVASATAYFCPNANPSTITLMEIAQ